MNISDIIALEGSTCYDLLRHRQNMFSQFGEDGLLSRLFNTIGSSGCECVELGGGDGITNSNVRKLIRMGGWKGTLIEKDEALYKQAQDNYGENDDVTFVQGFVTPDNINELFDYEGINSTCSLLVLDVDGDEWHLWKALDIRPRVVMVEANPTFPFNVEFIQKPGNSIGSSVLALYRLGKSLGYSLVCFNVINCVFVRNDIIGTQEPFVRVYHYGKDEDIYVSKSYDGKLYTYGKFDYSGQVMLPSTELEKCAEVFIAHDVLSLAENGIML